MNQQQTLQPTLPRSFQSRNPATGEINVKFSFLSNDEVNQRIERSHKAFLTHSQTDLTLRLEKLQKLASVIEKNREKIVKLITQEMGKPITMATRETQLATQLIKYYIDNAERLLKSKEVVSQNKKSFIEYHPLGSIFYIIPFNYPFILTFGGTIPSLLLGNTVLHRPADSTPLLGKAIEDLFVEAGFTNGEFQTVFTSPEQTELVLSNTHVKGVSFTGSTRAGGVIASIAGKYAKKVVMELGGSDPFIVLGDADVEKAVTAALAARLTNSGQVCCGAKRFIIDDSVYDRFKQLLLEKINDYKPGDPTNLDTKLGPLARPDLRDNIERQVQEGQRQGAKLLHGGKRPENLELQKGDFFTPTVVELDHENNILFKEETFGPVFALLRTRGEDEMVRIANDSDYGLASIIFSEDVERAQTLGKKIEAGTVVINGFLLPDPALPFGGVKGSGFGRKHGSIGIHEFANVKTVSINDPRV